MSPLRAAKLENSPRLQKVLRHLRDVGATGVTTEELQRLAGITATGVAVAELRANGFKITARRYGNGAVYVLVE